MKKTRLIVMLMLVLAGCKELANPGTQPVAEAQTITGEFLYWNNAAVLKTDTEIYGVTDDEKMHELDQKCRLLKKDAYDMVAVVIKGVITNNPVAGSWKEVVQVKEIISVSASQEKEDPDIIIKNNR